MSLTDTILAAVLVLLILGYSQIGDPAPGDGEPIYKSRPYKR